MLWGITSAVGVILGSLGTWVTAGPFSVTGTQGAGDGWFSLGAGVLLLLGVAVPRARLIVLPLAGIAAAIGITDSLLVLRTHGNELFSVSLGWGLVVLSISSVSLVAWGIAAIARRQIARAWTLGLLTVALTVALVVLGASGRFHVQNDSQEVGTDVGPALAGTAKPPKPRRPASTCDARGINATQMKQGQCTQHGIKVDVANRLSTAHLDVINVRLEDTSASSSIGDVQPEGGVFVTAKLTITNTSKTPIDESDIDYALLLGDSTYTPSFDAEAQLVTTIDPIGPGISRTVQIPFDVPDSAVTFLISNGTLQVIQPGDDTSQPTKRIAVLRTYSTAQSAADTSTAPTTGSATTDGYKTCADGTMAGAVTTCDFAENVSGAYAVMSLGTSGPITLSAPSAATGQDVSMRCTPTTASITCTGGKDAHVKFTQDLVTQKQKENAGQD